MDREAQSSLRNLAASLGFDHLRTFQVAVRTGSFRRAAEELMLSQPAVSQRIKHLEGILGASLFDRQRGSSVRLTRVGERLLAFSDIALNQLSDLHKDVENLKQPVAEEVVTVAAGPAFIKYRLLHAVQLFKERFPSLEIGIRQGSSPSHIVSMVLSGEAELGVYTGSVPDRKLRSFSIGVDNLLLVARSDHEILQAPKSARRRLLADAPFGITTYGAHSRQLVERWASSIGVKPKIILEVADLDVLKEGVLVGIVLSVLPDFALAADFQEGAIAAVDMKGLPLERKVALIADADRPLSATGDAFVKVLRKSMRKERPSA